MCKSEQGKLMLQQVCVSLGVTGKVFKLNANATLELQNVFKVSGAVALGRFFGVVIGHNPLTDEKKTRVEVKTSENEYLAASISSGSPWFS